MEHQFTPNENMPLRMLLYVGRVYERLIESRSIYRQKLVKIPKPEFIVLYNGEKDCPDRSALSLSDAFLGEGGGTAPVLDLKVKVYNVNYGRNPEILRKSKSLSDYAAFISRVRGNRAGGAALGAALREAIRYCVDHGIMREYLEANGSEVENMLFTEFNMDEAIQVWKEEGREEGIEEGIEKGKLEDALNLIKEGVPLEVIARATGLPYGKLADLPCGDQI
jgi:hypothetical protein